MRVTSTSKVTSRRLDSTRLARDLLSFTSDIPGRRVQAGRLEQPRYCPYTLLRPRVGKNNEDTIPATGVLWFYGRHYEDEDPKRSKAHIHSVLMYRVNSSGQHFHVLLLFRLPAAENAQLVYSQLIC